VATIARWPGRTEPGAVIHEPCWTPDLLVTVAAIAGAQLPGERVLDGKDISPL